MFAEVMPAEVMAGDVMNALNGVHDSEDISSLRAVRMRI